jgi:TetR/AcrR family transcriptional regulator, transcriptional repressor for nem operon
MTESLTKHRAEVVDVSIAEPATAALAKRRLKRGESRDELIWQGTAILTERGFLATGIDEVLKRAGVPKGSFYHCFKSKHEFGEAVLDNYLRLLGRKLDRTLGDRSRTPLVRLQAFVEDARGGLAKYEFRRGCLVGNLGQELGGIDDAFRMRLEAAFQVWEDRFADCLREAMKGGDLPGDADPESLARFFWIGWEGAILRSKLTRSAQPLDDFAQLYFEKMLRSPYGKR